MSKTLGRVAEDRFREVLAKPDADEATAWQAAAEALEE